MKHSKNRLVMRRTFICGLVMMLLLTVAMPLIGFAASDKATITTMVNVRNMPSTKGESLGILVEGTRVQILWNEGDWYRIKLDTIEGYVRNDFLKIDGTTGSSSTTTASTTSASLPTGKVALGAKNAQVGVLQSYLADLGYYTGTIDNVFGSGTEAALKAFQRENNLAADGICGSATRQKLQLLTASATANGTVKLGDKGDAVTAMQKALKTAGYLSTCDGVFGTGTQTALKNYQKDKGLTADGICGTATWKKLNASTGSASTSSSTSSSVARIELGDTGSGVSALQQGLKDAGYYNGSVDGKFGKITDAALRAYQKDNSLTADGVFGSASQQKMLGKTLDPSTVTKGSTSTSTSTATTSSVSPSGVELIPWSEANGWWPVGKTATIYDIGTGISYTIYRYSGSVHADVETLTADDSAKMKESFGGSWKWTPRPVLVTYNGRTSAASINGMPHANQTIMDNDMDGQVCLHFLGSTTHDTTAVKHAQDHQNAVQKAWTYAKSLG